MTRDAPPIRVLDSVTIGQIAAGEVIERPVSVVKELVENAVDAGATRVTVRVARGGAEEIEVTDDGSGIVAEQLVMAVRRHATSKIAASSDLDSIGTFGFRGEGLASIAAVARMEITSRSMERDVGATLTAHAETHTQPTPTPAPVGTSVRATELFAELPARREYLRTPNAEFARISTFVSTFALAHPQVAFSLHHDGREVWNMPATSDLRSRLALVFGREAARALLPLMPADTSIGGRLHGYVSAPGYDRPDRRMQVLFVNRRLVRNHLMAGAWSAGYATFAMTGRQPYGVLFLELRPDSVDANVHPAKSEVRLRYGAQVTDGVRRTIGATLRAHASERAIRSVGGTPDVAFSAIPENREAESVALFETATASPRLRVLAQIARTYVLASDGESLLLVDQHAAHERIAFEALQSVAANGERGEPLLVPRIVEVNAEEEAALHGAQPAFAQAGLEIEPFGERAFRIVAQPSGYGPRSFDLRAFLDDLRGDGRTQPRERIWASLACHSVTVAGERLEFDEMTSLVERLQTCANPMHCPHGRPTMIRMEPGEIARMFKRA